MSVQSLNLFSTPIAKFAVDKWESKKDKLLELISFEGCDIVECQTDYYKYNTISPYLDDFVNIIPCIFFGKEKLFINWLERIFLLTN